MAIGSLALAVTVAGVAVAVSAVAVELGESRVEAATGTIAFVRSPSPDAGGGRLYLMSSDGSRQRRRTPASGAVEWSPDGRKIAVAGPRRIYVTDENGVWRHAISGDPAAPYLQCLSFQWSPDSRKIAYTHNYSCDGPIEMFVVNADGSGRRQLTPAAVDAGGVQPFYDSDPAWSPDGRSLAFIRTDRRNADARDDCTLVVMSVDGLRRRTVRRAQPGGAGSAVVWSRDGKRIFYVNRRGLLAAVNRATGKIQWLPARPQGAAFALSPSGRKIVFQASDGKDWEIYVVNTDGTAKRQLTDNRRIQDVAPRWSPDERTILFVTDRDGNSEIYAMNADGSRKRNLTRNPAEDFAPAWAPP